MQQSSYLVTMVREKYCWTGFAILNNQRDNFPLHEIGKIMM